MDRLIDDKTASSLKERFSKELNRIVNVRVYTDKKTEQSQFTVQFLEELSLLTDKFKLSILSYEEGLKKGFGTDPTVSFGEESGYSTVFNGTPAGHEANTVLETLVLISAGKSGLSKETEDALKKLDKKVRIQTFVTPTCPYCPMAAIMANSFSLANPEFISSEIIEAQENPELSTEYGITAVPLTVINGDKDSVLTGVQPEKALLEAILKHGFSGFNSYLKEKEAEKEKLTHLDDNPDRVLMLTDSNFKEAVRKYPRLVVDCWAEWCAPCRMVSPVVEELSNEYAGRVVFAKLNVDENPAISQEFAITSIPTVLLFKDGMLLNSIVGAKPKAFYENEITQQFRMLIV